MAALRALRSFTNDRQREQVLQPGPAPEILNGLQEIIGRLHRRWHDVVRHQLVQLGVYDVSPAQMQLLLSLRGQQMTVRDIMEDGYRFCAGTRETLSQLRNAGYVDWDADGGNDLTTRASLSEAGEILCDRFIMSEQELARCLMPASSDEDALEQTYGGLRKLERDLAAIVLDGDVELM